MNIDELDPGIRELVLRLQSEGYTTTDSGDGVSKPLSWYANGCAMPFAHVVCLPWGPDLIAEAQMLALHLPPGWIVEASYSTYDRKAILLAREPSVEEKRG